MNAVIQEDVEKFAQKFALGELLTNSTLLITGATGLVGSTLIRCLIGLKKQIKIIAPVRNKKKALTIFESDQLAHISLIECDFEKFDDSSISDVDYVIHCAAPTASSFFVSNPVETFNTIIDGTKCMLNLALKKKIKGMVYLSSLEVYGEISDGTKKIPEEFQGYLDPLAIRSSYPMAKRASENLCSLYASQYGVPVKIARLTQTTGAGIEKNDERVVAQFAKCAFNNQDIILRTTGESARPYCYITDSVSAILYILLKGKTGDCYNVANEETFISAKDMAFFVSSAVNNKIKVRFEIKDNNQYAAPTQQNLQTTKIRNLGWAPEYGLKDIFDRLIKYLASIY